MSLPTRAVHAREIHAFPILPRRRRPTPVPRARACLPELRDRLVHVLAAPIRRRARLGVEQDHLLQAAPRHPVARDRLDRLLRPGLPPRIKDAAARTLDRAGRGLPLLRTLVRP